VKRRLRGGGDGRRRAATGERVPTWCRLGAEKSRIVRAQKRRDKNDILVVNVVVGRDRACEHTHVGTGVRRPVDRSVESVES